MRKTLLDILLSAIPVLAFNEAAALAYGRIIAQCGWVRSRELDLMIAAHAIATASILVTNNTADLIDIPDLILGNWLP